MTRLALAQALEAEARGHESQARAHLEQARVLRLAVEAITMARPASEETRRNTGPSSKWPSACSP